MDQNLSGMVALNATLIQPLWIPIITIFAAPLSAGIGALAVYYASKGSQDNQVRIEDMKIKKIVLNDKIQAYSNLVGCKYTMSQYHASFLSSANDTERLVLNAKINAIAKIDLNPHKDHLLRKEPEKANHYFNEQFAIKLSQSIDLGEGLRARSRTLELEIKTGEAAERFWRAVGQVMALFADEKTSNIVEDISKAEKELICC